MNPDQIRLERRPAQRFMLHLPVSVQCAGTDRKSSGYTQDLSAQGVLFYTDLPLADADMVELTFTMPSEITLAEAMRVRCRGKVMRVVPSAAGTAHGVAVRFEGYEFLPEPESLVSRSDSFAAMPASDEAPAEEKAGLSAHSFHAASPMLP